MLFIFTGIGSYLKCLRKRNFISHQHYMNVDDRFLWGGKEIENSSYSKHSILISISIYIITFLHYLYCSYSVFFLQFSTHSMKFSIFWIISKVFIVLVKKILKKLTIETSTAFIFYILPGHLFFYINYRIIFFDQNLSLETGVIIVLETIFLEFFFFFFPLTECYRKLRNLCPCFFDILFSDGDKDYIKEVIGLSYFFKVLSIIWSLLGTLSTFYIISLTSNQLAFKDYPNNLEIIAIKSILVLTAEIFTFFIIEIFYRKLFGISAWNNYQKIFSSEWNMIIFIIWPLHVLQDPTIAGLHNLSVY